MRKNTQDVRRQRVGAAVFQHGVVQCKLRDDELGGCHKNQKA